MTGKLSNKDIDMKAIMYDIRKDVMIMHLEHQLPMLNIRSDIPVPCVNPDFGWVRMGIFKGKTYKSEILGHPTKQVLKFKGIKYKLVDIKVLAVEVYKDADMEMEALLWKIGGDVK